MEERVATYIDVFKTTKLFNELFPIAKFSKFIISGDKPHKVYALVPLIASIHIIHLIHLVYRLGNFFEVHVADV